jgi:hypothetical protein
MVLQKILLQQTELAAFFCPRHASERNSELVSLPRNGLERNSESLLLFLFHGTEFLAFSPLWNDSERNSEIFLFRGTAGIPPEQTNYSVYSVFLGIIFLSEIANPSCLRRTKYNYIFTYLQEKLSCSNTLRTKKRKCLQGGFCNTKTPRDGKYT